MFGKRFDEFLSKPKEFDLNFSEIIISFLTGLVILATYRHYCPMLVAQWQHGVTRKDLVDTLSFEALKKVWFLFNASSAIINVTASCLKVNFFVVSLFSS